ncbi:PspC domain-containing protein [Maribacter sp. PR1]|uniref:PspC domain-containing protein n=1 Tax=Maribacter cobaltidurans TaxID=1178778 RepID=A0ABU7IUR9_9FLAO|nr:MULTISPECIES: PspC domain-containing protein [Maribacter]MDC6389344.1 PspC domain-containing protein [Maribacter sp. PR1]MEE1976732.1 PspC domain-containing protein [Maribacter cobaltidurans]
MNKTVNINLANTLFHIDEDAYNKMRRYLESVKRSFANTPGSDEILADIEARIAELFYEKLENERQVITQKQVDEVIAIMGQPEDYMVDEDIFEDEPKTKTTGPTQRVKKLYRDTEHKYVAGVSSGLAHYLGIDPLWIRILWVFLTIGSGGGFILLYGLLWILIPEATTTAQKLDMRGEAVNISNIERKVKEGFDDVADRVKSVDYEKVGNTVKKGGKTFFDTLGDIIMFLFGIFGKFIGILLIIIGASTLIGLFVGLLSVGILDMVHVPGIDFYNVVNSSNLPIWVVSLLAFFAIGIPFFFLLYLGLKILVNNLKSIGNIAKFSLLGLWLISIILLIVFGIREAAAHAYSGSSTSEKELYIENPMDTLNISLATFDYDRDRKMHMGNMIITHDENGDKILVSEDVRFRIRKSTDSIFRIEIRKEANGPSFAQAKETAESINYDYTLEGNNLNLNNYLQISGDSKFNDQEIRVNLFVPVGTVLTYDHGEGRSWVMRADTDRDIANLDDYTWEMESDNELRCLDCPADMDYDEDSNNRVRINENGIDININDNDGESFKMKIDENGVRINAKENDEEKVDINIDANDSTIDIKAQDGDTTMRKTISQN